MSEDVPVACDRVGAEAIHGRSRANGYATHLSPGLLSATGLGAFQLSISRVRCATVIDSRRRATPAGCGMAG